MSERREALSPEAQARFDAAPEWMQNATYIDWESDPADSAKKDQAKRMTAKYGSPRAARNQARERRGRRY